MGRFGWLIAGLIVLVFLTCVKVHYLPGHFGDSVSFEFAPPWR
jgi:hypothetical protein